MWSLFSKYDGMDETKELHKFRAPSIMPPEQQAILYFRDSDKALVKVVYGTMEFPVDVFESCKVLSKCLVEDPSTVFTKPERCGVMSEEELEGLKKLALGLFSGVKNAMNPSGSQSPPKAST
eukprot:TRINITY_DN10499_c0_g4_i1.p2 TRINITY_DN10499_c0_g4~~TRINITY_DN10499_c0_g4_i1.p2  ORF type:complete len:122 (-),score=22.38 TRINITY_DN10499_c0_g4_i1:90-455(-)